jgi:transposase-like protein
MEEKVKSRWVWNESTQRHQRVEFKTGTYSYSEDEKISIVSEYVSGNVPANVIIEKYHLGSRQQLFNWMDRYINENDLVSLSPNKDTDTMIKKTPEERLKELEAENKRLQKALELERLRSKAFDTMINLAEETFNIPIRKKSGIKQ